LVDNHAPVRARGPGRLNLIGEHTDYNRGLCLPVALNRGVTVTARTLKGNKVDALALDLRERDSFSLDEPSRAEEGWRAFVRGTVAELRAAGFEVPAAEIQITGDLPRGSGLSSSAALESALCLALLALSDEAADADRLELARLCSRVENDWVGARTGLLDQLAAFFCRKGHALHIDMASMELVDVPLELGGWTLATLDSGAAHDNASSGYNERRAECERAAELLGVESLREAKLEEVARLPDPLDRRVRHVIEENLRVHEAVAALRRGDLAELARLIDSSHRSLRDLYEVSVPELEAAREGMKAAGAAGARLVGGGFGGSVMGLFPPGTTPPSRATTVIPAGPAHVLRTEN
jgi:galactokinase